MPRAKIIGLLAAMLLLPGVKGAPQEPRFPHGKEKHRALACAKCHALAPGRIEVEAWPGHAACVSCHNLALEAMVKPRVFCGVCHADGPITKEKPALLPFPRHEEPHRPAGDFGVKFSHEAHLRSPSADPACRTSGVAAIASGAAAQAAAAGREPRCTDCHRRLDAAGAGPEMALETGHAACFACHCERPLPAPAGRTPMPTMRDCAQCHLLGGPKSPRLYGLVRAFRHLDHELDTRPRQKADARRPRPDDHLCLECHQAVRTAGGLGELRLPEERACQACHNGRIGLPEPLAREVVESLRRR